MRGSLWESFEAFPRIHVLVLLRPNSRGVPLVDDGKAGGSIDIPKERDEQQI